MQDFSSNSPQSPMVPVVKNLKPLKISKHMTNHFSKHRIKKIGGFQLWELTERALKKHKILDTD